MVFKRAESRFDSLHRDLSVAVAGYLIDHFGLAAYRRLGETGVSRTLADVFCHLVQ